MYKVSDYYTILMYIKHTKLTCKKKVKKFSIILHVKLRVHDAKNQSKISDREKIGQLRLNNLAN